jgi:hypothetical protein
MFEKVQHKKYQPFNLAQSFALCETFVWRHKSEKSIAKKGNAKSIAEN